MKVKSILKLLVAVLIIAALSWVAVVGVEIGSFNIPKFGAEGGIIKGLDIAGGSSVMYEADKDVTEEESRTVIGIMQKRLEQRGFTEATVVAEGSRRFAIEIPSVKDTTEVVGILGTPANLTFTDAEGNVLVAGKDVKKAQATQYADQYTGIPQYVVSLTFNEEGAKQFADATTALVGQPLYIVLDGVPMSAPMVNEPITNGEAMISGDFTYEYAEELADLINSGSLPVNLTRIQQTTVDATLGKNSFENAIIAALIALAIIMVYMIAFYRLPGLMASLALCAYTAIVANILTLMHVNLTLSGVAGIVLSMGMAVDANCVIFERIIDELKLGKSVPAAVEAGFDRAMAAVIDSNITTVISSLALWFFGTGTVKGFAITLLIGVIVSMFTAIIVTKFFMKRLVELGIKNRKLYGFGVKA